MTISRKALCIVYGLIAIAALVFAWGNVIGAVGELGFWAGTLKFWEDVLVNESSRFITVDILYLSFAVIIWMIFEARKVGVPFVWAYILGGLFIAISAAVPLFLLHRQVRLAKQEPNSPAGTLDPVDLAGLLVIGVASTVFAARTLAM